MDLSFNMSQPKESRECLSHEPCLRSESSECSQCFAAFCPLPFPEQSYEDDGRYTDDILEDRFSSFYFDSGVGHCNSTDGEALIDMWQQYQRFKWRALCRDCWEKACEPPQVQPALLDYLYRLRAGEKFVLQSFIPSTSCQTDPDTQGAVKATTDTPAAPRGAETACLLRQV